MSLIEILVATGVLAVLASLVYALMANSSQTYASVVRLTHIQEQARRVIDELDQELRVANPATMVFTPTVNPTQVQFSVLTGYDTATKTPQWGAPITWGYQARTAQQVDANENGLLDEGTIVRTQGGRTITKCQCIEAGGVTFTVTGNYVVIRLTLISVDAKKLVMRTYLETSVRLRNTP